MFKIAHLDDIEKEQIEIKIIPLEICRYHNGEKKVDKFNTLSFDIYNDIYDFSFYLNCQLEKLLELPMSEKIDFKEYICEGDIWLNVKEENSYDISKSDINVQITRYLKNRFIILIHFFTYEDYSGMVEFSFNLDDYLF